MNKLYIKNLAPPGRKSLRSRKTTLWDMFSGSSLLLVLLTVLLGASAANAQTAGDYQAAYSATGGTLNTTTALTSSTPIVAAANDDDFSAATAIGFNFSFCGVTYTHFRANANGWVRLGTNASLGTTTSSWTNSSARATANTASLYALWDDINTGSSATTGGVRTVLDATNPSNQIRIIDWRVAIPRNTTGPTNAQFQIWIYQNGNIEFRYGDGSNNSNTANSGATIGIATTGGTGNFNVVQGTSVGSTPTFSSSTFATGITTGPTSGSMITFTPPAPCTGTPSAGTLNLSGNQTACTGGTIALTSTGATTLASSGISYQWLQSTDGGNTFVNAVGGSGATTASYTTPAFSSSIIYVFRASCSNSGLTAQTSPVTFNQASPPSTGGSIASFSLASSTSITLNLTPGNGTGRLVYFRAGTNSFTDPTNGTALPTASTSYSGTAQQVVMASNATSVTITGLTPSTTTYFARVVEYSTCTSGGTTFIYNTSGTGTDVSAPNCTTIPSLSAGTLNFSGSIVRCASSTTTITATGATFNGFPGISYQWEQSTDDGISWANAVGGTGATTLSYTTPSYDGTSTISYRLSVRCSGGSSVSSSPVTIVPNTPPATQGTPSAAFTATTTSITIPLVAGNGIGRAVFFNTVNSFTNPTNGAALPTASTTYTSGQQCVMASNSTSVTVSGLVAGTTYFVRVYEYNFCTATGAQYNTTGSAFTVSTRTATISFVPTYGPSATPYVPVAKVVGTNSIVNANTSNQDDATGSIPANVLAGFNFTYQGVPVTALSACTNGWLSFSSTTSSTFSNVLATTTPPAPLLAPFFEDLFFTAGVDRGVWYEMRGTAPNRQLVIEWNDAEIFLYPGPSLNFQVILNETTNVIEYKYGVMQGFDGTNPNPGTYPVGYGLSYSVGLSASTVTSTPTAGQLLALERENTNSFVHYGAATANQGLNALTVLPDCNSSYVFTPGTYTYSAPAAFTAPVNDEPAGSITINPLTTTPANFCGTFYSSFLATSSGQPVNSSVTGSVADDDVWFNFVANSTNTTIVVRGSGGYQPVIELFDASSSIPGTSIAATQATGSGLTATLNSTSTVIGRTYYVRVYHSGGGTAVTATAVLTSGAVTGITVNSAGSGYAQAGSLFPRIILTGGDGTGAIANVTALASGGISTIGVMNGGSGYTTPPSVICLPGSGVSGNFSMVINATPTPPANDNCDNATLISTAQTCTPVTGSSTLTATASSQASCGVGSADDDVWYSFVPSTTSATVQVTGAVGFNPVVELFSTSSNCSALTSLGCTNNSGSGQTESVSLTVIPGATYYVRVYHFAAGSGTGNHTICITENPPVCVSSFSPVNGAGAVFQQGVNLTWAAVSGATGYDVYFGTTNPPTTLVASNTNLTSYSTGTLVENTLYYWVVNPRNAIGANTSCSILSFTTGQNCNSPANVGSITQTGGSLLNGAVVNLTASGASNILGYQWQVSTVSASGPFTAIPGATGQVLNYTFPAVGTYYFRVDGTPTSPFCAPVSSNVVSLTASCNPSVAGAVSGSTNTAPICTNLTFNVSGNTGTIIQWQKSATGLAGSWSNIAGATSASLVYSETVSGTYYIRYYLTTDVVCTADTAASYMVQITPAPTTSVGTLSGPTTLYITQAGDYTLTGATVSTFTWQSSTTGLPGSWTTIAGVTGNTANLFPNVAGTVYLRAFGNIVSCVGDTSNVLAVTTLNVPELSYTVTRQTGITYNSIISGGNNFSWPGTSTDDQMSNALDVSGLNFVYQGIPVTSLRVNTNGFLTFLGTNSSSFSNIMTSTSALAQLSPYWDDLVVGNNSGGLTQLNASIKYLITGVSPNQVMTVEWSDMGRFNNTNLNFAFQVKLYEGSNRIEYIYGNNVPYDGVSNFDPTYSVGLSSRVTTSSNYFISQAFENTANFTTGSTTGTAQDALAIPPTCNSMIRFQPSVSMSLPTDAAATVSNNEPASAELLTVPLGSYSDNCDVRVMRGATLNGTLTLPACAPSAFTAQNDVWYTFTTTGGGQHTINLTPNGGYDIAFQLLRGSISSLVNDTCVNAGAVGVRETLTRTLLPSTTYYLRVVSNNIPTSSVGAFSIAVFRVAAPPANDNCSGAITLAANTPVVSGNTGDATASTGFTSCGIGNANDDVWYSFTATGTFSTISVVPGVGFNPVVQVLTGSCGTQTSVSCTNSTGINGTETVNITTVPGTTYFVRVYDFAASTPATGFTITLSTPVPACPTMATPGNGSSTVNSANDVVFTWNSVTGGTITYTLQVSDDPSFATLLVDSSGLTGLTATVVAPRFAESTTYFWRVLAVNSNGSSTGCTANSFSTIGTVPSCITSSTPANGATNQATNVTLSWTAGGGAPTGYDVFFGLPGALTLVSSNQAGTSYATSGLSNNTIYSWRIVPKNANGDAIGCQARSFTTVPAAPANDECINAVSMTVNGAALISQSSAFATQSQAPCTGAQANDVWYSFVANGANQNISVVGAGGLNAIVQLFSGSCGSLSSISCVNNTGNNGSESINATGLTPGQTYFVRVYNANSGLSSGTSFSIEVTNQIVWNGSAWVGGTPGPSTAGTNITINAGSAAVLPNGTELNNLYVMNGGSVSLGTGTVTVNGNITFAGSGIQTFGGTGTLVFGGTGTQFINGGASVLFNGIVRISTGSTLSTSSLILGDGGVLMHGTGTAGGGGNFTGSLRQRRAGSTSNLRYNLWSSPMSGSTLSNLLGNDLYSFNRTTQSWSAETPATVMQVGVGYSATGNINGFGGAGIRQFSGTPNNGDVNVPMSVNPGLNDDWNLVGNPYPSAINGLTFISNNSDNIVGPLYFWNTSFSTISANNNFTGADYATRSLASGPFHIGVAQGFFVEATSTLLEFTNSQRSTTNNVFLRNSSPVQRVTLLAHNAQNVANSTLIAFTSDATDNYDRLWDARKYKGNPTVSLYSKVGSMDAAINAMGELSTNKVVSLGLDVNTSGTHTIMIDQLENVDATTGIYLQDMQTGAMHNLRTSGYSFQAQAGSITNRFYVHFQPMVTSVVTVKQGQPTMVMSGDVLRINGLNEGTVVEGIQVLDMSGRRVISVSGMSESGQVERRVELPLGVYLIEVQTNRGVFTEKVFKSVR